jgi:hypothetical protein
VFTDTALADTEIPSPAPTFSVTLPVNPPPTKPLPAITEVISPPASANPKNSFQVTLSVKVIGGFANVITAWYVCDASSTQTI